MISVVSSRPSDIRSSGDNCARALPKFLCCMIWVILATAPLFVSAQNANPSEVQEQFRGALQSSTTGQTNPKTGSTPAEKVHPPGPSAANEATNSNESEPFKKKMTQGGIAIEFSMKPTDADKRPVGKFQEGDDVRFRFSITDTATGTSVAGANPAAWMVLRSAGSTTDDRSCTAKVKELLSGSLFSRAELDLNVYYVLALNDDASITVVDPLFGYGGTKLLAMVSLQSPGEDWVLTSDQARLFVSMPDSNRVAVIETATWKVIRNLDAGLRPTRLGLQPDQQYLWVATGTAGGQADDSGVAVVNTAGLEVAARVPTGKGPHQIALSDDNRFAFVTNRDDGTVSIIDIRTLKKIKDISTGRQPTSIAFSTLSRMAYVVNEADGSIVAVDGTRQEIAARIQAEPGLGQIKFAPGGRLGFVVNPEKNVVHILDASTNRIVQTGDVEKGPDQVAFSSELVYVRHRGSDTVLMIPLKEVGVEGKPVPVVDFTGGQMPFGKASRPSPADGIIQAPGENAVLVANPADRAIYYYKEGLAAPMGNFSNYGREPRAVLVVDRSLKERSPGVYETVARLRQPGSYDVAFFIDAPRVVHCFDVSVEVNPELAKERNLRPVEIQPLIKNHIVRVGEHVRLPFKLVDPTTKQPKTGLKDVRILTFLAPGIWQKRAWAQPVGEGVYEIDFVPPQSGIYYVYVECLSLGLRMSNPQYLVLQAINTEEKEQLSH